MSSSSAAARKFLTKYLPREFLTSCRECHIIYLLFKKSKSILLVEIVLRLRLKFIACATPSLLWNLRSRKSYNPLTQTFLFLDLNYNEFKLFLTELWREWFLRWAGDSGITGLYTRVKIVNSSTFQSKDESFLPQSCLRRILKLY
jgi:hypothetical protein